MMKELARFGALMLVITFGFALAFYAMFGSVSASQPDGGAVAEYDTYYSSLLTLFASMLGNFDFKVGLRAGGRMTQPLVFRRPFPLIGSLMVAGRLLWKTLVCHATG